MSGQNYAGLDGGMWVQNGPTRIWLGPAAIREVTAAHDVFVNNLRPEVDR